ncbi:ABC transporter substrate-binding protein [Rugamonas sp. CCM 8940]|uniref:ABC transporter substrate-binding protein n=1 Tax=Rugamonas sp. CCM 8940 TaxID=2765359 RepID=UPI0018F30CB3|nr:ABC transporter substrate-binding protein [Rugamonas sp. CCM 8940]MBJ7312208.1 ABC transporter substrate-binding protein [Rugamonas sp. CCM 8940]
MFKILALSFAVLSLTPALAQADSKPLRIGWVRALANAPALIAEKNGYYAQEGLNVELKAFGDGPIVQQALSSGDLDMAYIGAPPVFQWVARGLNSRILAKVNYGQAALIVNANSPVKSVADLRGKKVAGLAKGSGMDLLLRGYVAKELGGLEADKDVDIVSMPAANMNAALERGLVDAAFTWEPFVSSAVLRGSGKVLVDLNRKLPNYPWYVVMAVPRTLAERPDEVVKVLRAHRRAIAFLNLHPAEANQIIAEAFEIAPIKTAAGVTIAPAAIVQEARKRLGWSDKIEPTDLRFIQRLMDYSLSLGLLNRPLTAGQLVDPSWQQRAEQPALVRK